MIDIDRIAIEAIEERIKIPISEISTANETMFVSSAVMATVKALSVLQKEFEEKIKKQNETLLKITGWDQPYNLTEILSRLVFATDYLLRVKDYDGHNHEELNQSIDKAKEIIQFLETREAHFL